MIRIAPTFFSRTSLPTLVNPVQVARVAVVGAGLFRPNTALALASQAKLWETRGESLIYYAEWADRAAPWVLGAGALTFLGYRVIRKVTSPTPVPIIPEAIRNIPKAIQNLGETILDALPHFTTRPFYRPSKIRIPVIVLPEEKKSPEALTFPGYTVLRELGRGGAGVVYLTSKDDLLNSRFAIKVLSAEDKRGEREKEMYLRLNNPHVVKIFGYGNVDGRLYMILEYVEGGNLSDWIQNQILDREHMPQLEREAARILLGCLEGLEAIHQKELVHRDIKPANIFLDGTGAPKLGDFGLGRPVSGDTVTIHGVIVGTPQYMSPEMIVGERADIRVDIYALGITLFEMVTCCLPFELKEGQDLRSLLVEIIVTIAPNPRNYNPSLSEELAAIILKATQKERENRYQTPAEFKEALRKFLEGSPLSARRESSPTRAQWGLK